MATRSLVRRLVATVGLLLGLVVMLLVATVLLLDSGAVTRRVVDLVLPKVSASLGREVTLRGAELSLFPATRVRLDGLSVAGRPGEAPLVQAEGLDVELGLWPLLRSRGKELDVRSIALVRPIVTLTRAPDGTWSHEGLGKGAGVKAAPEPAPSGGSAARIAVRELRLEGGAVRVVDRSGGKDDAGLAVESLDVRANALGAGLPASVRIGAALGGGPQNVFAQLSVARVPEAIPARPEDWPDVQGSLRVGALALDRVRALLPASLGAIARGGTVSLDATVTTAEHALRVDGAGELEDLRLRGQPASGHFRAAARVPLASPATGRVDLTELVLRGPGVDLGGHASLELDPLRGWFVVTGPLLDLDALMGVLPAGEAPAQEAPRSEGPLLPAALRARVNAAAITGTIAVQTLRGGRLEATDVRAKARLAGGRLAVSALDAAIYGGRVDGGGSEVALGEAEPSWKLDARLSGVDLAKALQAFSGAAPLEGKVTGRLQVQGRGTQWEKIRDGLTGLAALTVADGALTTTDLGDEVLGAISKGLAAAGAGGAAAKAGAARGGRTTFRDLAGSFRVQGGALAAESPFTFQAPFGKVRLGGKLGLDGRLDLRGDAAVPRAALGGAARALPDTLQVPLGLQGTLQQPTVAVDAQSALSGVGRAAAERAGGEAERAGRRAVGDFLKGLGGKRR